MEGGCKCLHNPPKYERAGDERNIRRGQGSKRKRKKMGWGGKSEKIIFKGPYWLLFARFPVDTPSKPLIPPGATPEPLIRKDALLAYGGAWACPGKHRPVGVAAGFLFLAGASEGVREQVILDTSWVGTAAAASVGAFLPLSKEAHGTWTSWDGGPDNPRLRDAWGWGLSPSKSPVSSQARAACCAQEILNLLSLKEGTWNGSKITLNTSAGSYREGKLEESVKITLVKPGEHTEAGRHC